MSILPASVVTNGQTGTALTSVMVLFPVEISDGISIIQRSTIIRMTLTTQESLSKELFSARVLPTLLLIVIPFGMGIILPYLQFNPTKY
jgi:hypothetical protein